MIIFGGKASNIGTYDIPNTKCSYCENTSTQRISIFGKYAHIFWIPFFPIGKKAVAECTHCKRTIEKKEFSPKLTKLYNETKSQVKRPFWHWFGLGSFGLLVALIMFIGITAEKDARSDFLHNDIGLMTSNPTMESDSISFKIKQVFDSFANEDIKPSDFEYLTKIDGDKALILVRIPKLRKVEKEARYEALEMIQMITDGQEDLKGKNKYIGVKGVVSMMLIKTPTYEKNSKLASESELYEFYGPKQVVKE